MIVGLTGGIGSGKSTVAHLFQIMGCAVFDSDRVAKEVYFDAAIRPKVIALLGEESYLSRSAINKAFISSKIFNDTNLLQHLNAIIHPAVIARFKWYANEHPAQLILKETALLFEAKLEKEVDKIIMVQSNDALRIARVMQRDGLSKEQVLNKIKSQMAQEEKIKRSDFVISNNENESLIAQVLNVHAQLLKLSAN